MLDTRVGFLQRICSALKLSAMCCNIEFNMLEILFPIFELFQA